MKKFFLAIVLISALLFAAFVFKEPNECELYLRIHIRANSNEYIDQSVKYKVRDQIVKFLTPILSDCQTKQRAEFAVQNNLENIANVARATLESEGFNYGASAQVNKEQFPTRVYDGAQLKKGVYDALIVNLGSGEGANWWCVVYPPLCFTGEGSGQIKYQSKILEIIENFKKRS